MGIKFRCPDCQKKIHVKSYLAGKKGVCPTCGAKVSIPAEGEGAHHEADDDDVLDVHRVLSTYEGDLTGLLRRFDGVEGSVAR